MTHSTVQTLTDYAWNYLLPRLEDLDPPAAELALWLHLATEVDLDSEQIARFLEALVEAGAI